MIFLKEVVVLIQMPGVMPNFVVVFLVLQYLIPAARSVSVGVVNDQPDFPNIAVGANVFFLEAFHMLRSAILHLQIHRGSVNSDFKRSACADFAQIMDRDNRAVRARMILQYPSLVTRHL